MRRLTLDRVREVLPDLDELRPLWELAAARSAPDPERTWSGSGELGTLGTRLVDGSTLASAAAEVAEIEGRRLAVLYETLGGALRHAQSGDVSAAAASLLEAGALEEARQRPGRAEAYALAALGLVDDLRDRRPAALALRRAARAARADGRHSIAADRYREAHRIARASFDPPGAAEAAIGLGNVLEQQGAWEEAEAWYRRALEALEEVEAPTPERWQALLNIHITLRSRGRLAESEPWLERAEREAAAAGDGEAAVYLENARGQLHLSAGTFPEAERHLKRALEQADAAGPAVVVRLNLAEALLAQGRILEAAEEAREAERQAVVEGVFPRLPEAYRLLGRIAAREGNADAFVFFERALALIRERSLPVLEEAMTLQAYADVERERGEEEAAAELEAGAVARYRELGIEHARGAWSDTFAPAPPSGDTNAGDGT